MRMAGIWRVSRLVDEEVTSEFSTARPVLAGHVKPDPKLAVPAFPFLVYTYSIIELLLLNESKQNKCMDCIII